MTEPDTSSPYPKILDIAALEYRQRRRSDVGFDMKALLINRLTIDTQMNGTLNGTFGERELTELSII